MECEARIREYKITRRTGTPSVIPIKPWTMEGVKDPLLRVRALAPSALVAWLLVDLRALLRVAGTEAPDFMVAFKCSS